MGTARPSEVCMLLFSQMSSSVPTLMQVRGVTGKWNCASSVSLLPARLTWIVSPQMCSTGRHLSCLPPQSGARWLSVFAGFRKGLPHKNMGRWSVYLAHFPLALDYTGLPLSFRLRLLLQKRLPRCYSLRSFSTHQTNWTALLLF